MKKLLIILCVCALGFQSTAQSLKDITFGTDSTVEVITWNIEWFPKNGTITIDSVRQIIEALDADIIACQEIRDTNIWKQMVATLPDYETVFQTNYYAGLAYLYKKSTVQVLDYYEIYYTSPYWKNFPRAPKVLEVRIQNEDFIIINNHLKCCGDGTLSYGVINDEENRRYEAMNLIQVYIDSVFATDNVMVVGDLNDLLIDDELNNVFQGVIGDIFNYKFVDMPIANGSSLYWSYPNWPSHLDHILITNELFDEFADSNSVVETIRVGDYMQGGFSAYDNAVSDHRPVGFRFNPTSNTTFTKQEIVKSSMNVYPNPATDRISISFEATFDDGFLEMFNEKGQSVKRLLLHDNQRIVNLNVENLSAGIYYIKVYTKEGSIVNKVVVL